jgi:hypothetical protein
MIFNETKRSTDVIEEILKEAGLNDETSLGIRIGYASLFVTPVEFTPWQLVYTIEELSKIQTQLGEQLRKACATATDKRKNPVSKQLLDMADIPDSALLDVDIDQGEIYITETFLPDFAADMIEGTNIKMEQLRNLLLSDEEI